MVRRRIRRVAYAPVALLLAPGVAAQTAPRPPPPPPLFASHDVLPITLTADFAALVDDRRASPDRPATLTVVDGSGDSIEISAELRTRGEFRLDPSNCTFPPLRMDVSRRSAEGTLFEGQDNLKMVSSCRPGRSRYDEPVVLEYLAYRLYGLVTDLSFRVRAVEMTLVDMSGERPTESRFGFIIEEDDELAARHGSTVFDLDDGRAIPAAGFDVPSAMTTAVFEYLVGNTDWSAAGGHNVEILERSGVAYAAPYDFDMSGFVDAPYSAPAPGLGLSSARERLYRGWCTNDAMVRLVLDRFRGASDEMLSLVETVAGLDDRTRSSSLRYLRDFFEDIETDDRARRRFLRTCRTEG